MRTECVPVGRRLVVLGMLFVLAVMTAACDVQPIANERPPASSGAGPGNGPAPAPGTADGGDYPGQPRAGTVLWGATANPSRLAMHERDAGHPLALHRTFFQWRQRTGALPAMARSDLVAGRLPWVSIKTPAWNAMASGAHDREIDELLRGLDALAGPVWLTIHHEPEGGAGVNRPDDPAGPAGHLAMNRRVRERMRALGVDNIALVPVLMTYTWDPRSGRNPEQWWAPGVYDLLGVDHYVYDESPLVDDIWRMVRVWAKTKGVDVAVGEWGMRGRNAVAGARVRAWYDHALGSASDGGGARVVALAVFDSDLNSPMGGWTLAGSQLTTFHALLTDRRTAEVAKP